MSDPVRLPAQRDPDDADAIEEAISRHPAGRRQRRPYPVVTRLVVDEVGEPIEVS